MEENDLLDKYDGILVDEGGTESGFDRGISYVTFSPNQIKNIDNENPTDNDDIRYQLGIPSEMFYDPEAGDDRNRTANAYLTNMLQASKDFTPSEKDIKKVVKDITEAYNSKMNRTELTRQLTELYTYMRTNDHVDGAQVSETINAIAKQVIREATYTDPYQQEMYDKFRKAMRNTTLYVDKASVHDIEPEGWNALRQRYFGRIKLTANPEMSSHDGIRTYTQLQQDFPEIYRANVDDIMTDADAINEILYGFETARPKERSVFGEASTENEAAQELATRIMDAYFEVGNQSIKTQYQKTYKQVREEIRDEIIREYNDSLRAKQIEDAKALGNLKNAYAAGEISPDTFIVRRDALQNYARQQNDAARDLFRAKRDKYVDRIQRNKYKDDIIKTSKQLAKMILSPTDKQHIPTEMVEPITKVLQYIDFSSNRVHPDGSLTKRTIEADEFRKSIGAITNAIGKIEKNNSVYENNGMTGYLIIDPDLMQNLHETADAFADNEAVKDNVDNLDTNNLRTVAQTLKALKQMVNNANRFISAGRYESVSEVAKKSIEDFGEKYSNRRRGNLAEKANEIGQNRIVKIFDDLLNSGMLDAYTYFDTLGRTGHILYDDVRAGLDRKIRNTRTAVDYLEESLERNGVSVKERNKWENDLVEVTTRSGEPTKVSVAHLMSLYLLNKRGQARMHLYGDQVSKKAQNGGFILEASGKNGAKMDTDTVFKVSEQDVDRMLDKLTPQQKAVADDIGRFLTDVTSKWGNEVTQRLYGYNKFEAKNYFPIKVDNSTIAKTSQSLEQGMTMLKNMGQTKSVQQRAYNPLTLQNIFDVYVAQADDMGSYNAFVTSSADLQMWLNYKGEEGNVQREMKKAYGDKMQEYFMNILRDINGSRGNPSKWDKAAGALVGLQRGGAIWGNLRVAVQQPFAYIRALDTMNAKYLLQGLTLNPLQQAEEWELAKKYAPIAQWKDYGFFDVGVGPSMKRVILGNDTLKDKIADAGMWGASMGDTIAWVRLWYAAQAQVKDQHPELTPGTEEFYQEAGKVFGHVIDTTQVVDSVLHRSDIMKDKSTTVKNLTAFLSEPTKTYNMLYRSLRDTWNARGSKDVRKNLRRLLATVSVWAVSQAVNSAVASLISAIRYHDKDKELPEKYKEKFIADYIDAMQLWNSIPIIKQWISYLKNDPDDDPIYSMLSLLPKLATEIQKAKDGKSKKGWWDLVYQLSQLTTFWGGNNLQNPLRDMDGIIDNLIIGDNMNMYYPYQQAKYDMDAEQNGNYVNLPRYISTAMKAYAQGETELGDKIISDLKEQIPEDKVENQIRNRLKAEPELEELAQATLDQNSERVKELTESLKLKGYPDELISKQTGTVAKNLTPTSDDVARSFVEKSEGWDKQLEKFTKYYTLQGKNEKEIRSALKSAITKAYVDEYRAADANGKSELRSKLKKLKYYNKLIYDEADFTSKNSTWNK
jgi:Arc/MetJ-type ribon-helix-helix transcriptional regulator